MKCTAVLKLVARDRKVLLSMGLSLTHVRNTIPSVCNFNILYIVQRSFSHHFSYVSFQTVPIPNISCIPAPFIAVTWSCRDNPMMLWVHLCDGSCPNCFIRLFRSSASDVCIMLSACTEWAKTLQPKTHRIINLLSMSMSQSIKNFQRG